MPGGIDVVVLDIEMPVMDGLAALPLLLRADPGLRVIMASTSTTRGADIALKALRLGAADYVHKPTIATIANDSFRRELLAKVKGLARMRRRSAAAAAVPLPGPPRLRTAPRLLAIGSSTGGPQALFTLVQGLGRRVALPVVLTQHMPATFTPILAEHLSRIGEMPCAEAVDGAVLQPGHIALAPGNRHLLVEKDGAVLRARLSDAPAENYCRPSIDPMLRSATLACGGRVLMVMLTGMGHDGRDATGALVGTGLGSALVPHLLSSARLRAWRARWFHHGSFADLGIVLLAVWPLTQAHPGGLFFGTGDLRVWLGLTSGGLYAPWSFTLVETLVTAANTLGLGLLAAALLVPGRPRWPLLSVLLGLAIAARVGVFALLYSPAESLRWVTPGSMIGLALGLAALAGLLRLWPSARIRWAIWLLLAALLMVNTSPLNPYLIDPASVRFQVHVLDFSGLVRALGLAWPFLALIYLGLLRRRPNSPL